MKITTATINTKILVLVSLMTISAGTLLGQTSIGLKGGYGGGTARMSPVKEATFIWGMPIMGVSIKYMDTQKYVGAIQLDLQYIQQGFKIADNKDADTSYMRRVNSFMMPFMWHPNFQIFNGHAEVFFNAGVYLCYNVNSYFEWQSKRDGILERDEYKMINIRDNALGYGLTGGGGIGVYFGRFEWIVEARYNFGYSDILRNKTKFAGNPIRSPMDQVSITTGFFIRLGKNKK